MREIYRIFAACFLVLILTPFGAIGATVLAERRIHLTHSDNTALTAAQVAGCKVTVEDDTCGKFDRIEGDTIYIKLLGLQGVTYDDRVKFTKCSDKSVKFDCGDSGKKKIRRYELKDDTCKGILCTVQLEKSKVTGTPVTQASSSVGGGAISAPVTTDDPCADEGKCTIDPRRYVNWNTPEYSKMVYLVTNLGWSYGSCTAQYVAPNIILSAGHCVEDNASYFIQHADKGRTRVTLKSHVKPKTYMPPDYYNEHDYALFVVDDPDFYSDNYFNVQKTAKYGAVARNAGWGTVRVLSDAELGEIKQKLQKLCKKYIDCVKFIYEAPGSNKTIRDDPEFGPDFSIYYSVKERRAPSTGLKASDNCKIIKLENGNFFRTYCSSHPGNSGGAYYLGDELYGIVSAGTWDGEKSAQAAEGFYEVLQKVIRENPLRVKQEEPEEPKEEEKPSTSQVKPGVPSISDEVPATSDESQVTPPAADQPGQDESEIAEEEQQINNQINEKKDDLNKKLENIDNASGADVLDILFGMSDLEYLNEKLQKLKENAQRMRDKEQSLANRTLGAAAIGATGMGLMEMLSGKAEQEADAAAEADMKAYIATFACDYGAGRNIKGGQTSIEVPGGNDLIAAVTEYRALAADLKARKEALGKQPGIESEVIYDIAETGLYDNVGMGRQSGAFTSLYRAITDENSKDAAEWAQQKADSAAKVKKGTTLAAVGIIGGAIGNLAINSGDKNKNKVDEINNKYSKKIRSKIKDINDNPVVDNDKTCPSGATGQQPDCDCGTGKTYNRDAKTCDSITCPGDLRPDADGACKCPSGQQQTADNKCITPAQDITCDPDKHLVINSAGTACECAPTFSQIAPSESGAAPTACDCTAAQTVNEQGQCVNKPAEQPTVEQLPINASSLFKLGSATVEASAVTRLQAVYDVILKNGQSCTMKFVGYTDPVGSMSTNRDLSQRRAKAVRKVFEDAMKADTNSNRPNITFSDEGRGETECTCGVAAAIGVTVSSSDKDTKICAGRDDDQNVSLLPPKTEGVFAPCRRVVIETTCKSDEDTFQNVISGLADGVTVTK